eukprot:scaffold16436_cov118-Skeletonema_dohrnii-CCMP3373.AAC.1
MDFLFGGSLSLNHKTDHRDTLHSTTYTYGGKAQCFTLYDMYEVPAAPVFVFAGDSVGWCVMLNLTFSHDWPCMAVF